MSKRTKKGKQQDPVKETRPYIGIPVEQAANLIEYLYTKPFGEVRDHMDVLDSALRINLEITEDGSASAKPASEE